MTTLQKKQMYLWLCVFTFMSIIATATHLVYAALHNISHLGWECVWYVVACFSFMIFMLKMEQHDQKLKLSGPDEEHF